MRKTKKVQGVETSNFDTLFNIDGITQLVCGNHRFHVVYNLQPSLQEIQTKKRK